MTLPKDVLIDHRFRGMSAERVYYLIEEQQDQNGLNDEGENPDGAAPGGEGENKPTTRVRTASLSGGRFLSLRAERCGDNDGDDYIFQFHQLLQEPHRFQPQPTGR